MLIYTVPYNNDYKHTRPNINCGSLSGTFTCHDGHYFVIITISMSNTRSALGESCNGVKGRVKQLLERGRLPCTGHTQTIHKYYHTLAYEVSRTEYQALEETQHPMNINILLPEGQLDRTKGTLGGSGLDQHYLCLSYIGTSMTPVCMHMRTCTPTCTTTPMLAWPGEKFNVKHQHWC